MQDKPHCHPCVECGYLSSECECDTPEAKAFCFWCIGGHPWLKDLRSLAIVLTQYAIILHTNGLCKDCDNMAKLRVCYKQGS